MLFGAPIKTIPLVVQNLECQRNDRILFTGVNFELENGDILLVKGSNGSGKSSLLRILCNLATAESGEICWYGTALSQDSHAYYAEIAYLGHRTGVKDELTAMENLQIANRLLKDRACEDLYSVIKRVGLEHEIDSLTGRLSAGQRRRLGLAKLLLQPKRLWLLDEPQAALDTAGIVLLEGMLEEHITSGNMLIMATHHVQQFNYGRVKEIVLGVNSSA